MDDQGEVTLRRAAARAEAAELELERAHRLLDAQGVPRDFRAPGERDYTEYSLHQRLLILLGDDES